MNCDKNIECTIESIKIIEEQIKFFQNNKPLFWQKKKIRQYNFRIRELEASKEYLYRLLEYRMYN